MPRYYRAQLEDFPQQIQIAVQRWITSPKDGLLVSGPTGTGKTYLACAIVRAIIEAGDEISFIRCADFIREMRDTFSDSSEISEAQAESRYVLAPLLVLDDLAAGSVSDYERRAMLNLLDLRWNYLRPTIVTSNLSLEQIGTVMDERISSRLCSYVSIVLGGRDRRAR